MNNHRLRHGFARSFFSTMAAAASGSTPPLIFQKHPSVPSSNAPPTFEWASHAWYNLRLDALQASATLDDAQAELLVKAFEARRVTLPCPECRAHFIQDWAEAPFTLAHARSAAAAIAWVEDLKTKVDARIAKTVATAAAPDAASKHARASGAPAQSTSVASPTRSLRRGAAAPAANSSRAAASIVQSPAARRLVPAVVSAHRTPTIAAVRAARVPVRAATTASGDALQRNVAIASALQQTRANASGRRGCNCGRR
jgi:hypothetical protein